jgi:hypothetical protein
MLDFWGNNDAGEISHLLISPKKALVAQWIERCPPEAEAAGSNPAECAMFPELSSQGYSRATSREHSGYAMRLNGAHHQWGIRIGGGRE